VLVHLFIAVAFGAGASPALLETRAGSLSPACASRAGRRLVLLASGPGFVVRDARRAWGTPLAVQRLTEVLAAHGRAFPSAAPLFVHDLSTRRGGRLPPHSTHRGGRDVDLRLPLRVPTKRYVDATPRTLDLVRTWDLIQRFAATGDVQEILLDRGLQRALLRHARAGGAAATSLAAIFEYPGHRHRRPRPMVIHWKGHRDHMHVRFRPAPQPPVPPVS
jgi:murein endopeptidase